MPAAPGDQQVPRPQEVFISYSRKDKEFVRRLDEALRSRGREAWVDWQDIRPTEDFMQAIYGAIEGADTFISVLTPDSVVSYNCGLEIAHAAANNKRMVPVVARDVKADTVPDALRKLNWIFYRDTDDFERATDQLTSALDTDLSWVHTHTRLLTRAIEWNANGKNNSFALRGDDLRSAERWLAEAGAQKERQPTVLQTEYIIASRKAAARRQRIMLGAVTFGFVVAIVLAVVAFFAEAKAKEAASRGNVSLARYSKQGGKNAQALAYLAQALRLNPENREAHGFTTAMLTQLSWHVPLTASMKHKGVVSSAQFSPDGQRVVTASDDETARLWDAASGKAIGEPMKHENAVTSAQFSPDGQRVVTVSWDETARLWDAASGKAIGESMKHEDSVTSAQFSPDGQRVVTASRDKTARLWDAATGRASGEPMQHEGEVLSAQFSPDGQRIVSASADKTARLWDAAIMTGKDTTEDILLLVELAEATGDVTLETVGQAENLKLVTPEKAIASREKIAAKFLGPSSKLTPLQRFMEWISPFLQITVSEWVERRIKEGTVEGLRAAMQVDPADARVTAHLGRRLADQALEQGADPDEARRARGQADFLTRRAQKLAPDSEEVKRLRDEVVNLLELKTN